MTQQAKIVVMMIRLRDTQEWFHAYDFMPPRLGLNHEFFVVYEAAARMSELASTYKIFESKQDGKYKVRKLDIEALKAALNKMPDDLATPVRRELAKAGLLAVDVF